MPFLVLAICPRVSPYAIDRASEIPTVPESITPRKPLWICGYQEEGTFKWHWLKNWRILRKLRCCPFRAGRIAKAIHTLQLHELTTY